MPSLVGSEMCIRDRVSYRFPLFRMELFEPFSQPLSRLRGDVAAPVVGGLRDEALAGEQHRRQDEDADQRADDGAARQHRADALDDLDFRDERDAEGRAEEDRGCLLYTSDAADDLLCVDLGGRRII